MVLQENDKEHIMARWFQKLLDVDHEDKDKVTFLGEELISQMKNKEFSPVFLHLEHLNLPVKEVYEMVKKEKDVIASLEAPVDIDNFTLSGIECDDCGEMTEKIKELQKIQEKQRKMITSQEALLKHYEEYVQTDIPQITRDMITNFSNDTIVYHSKVLEKVDARYRDTFLQSNQTICDAIHESLDAIMTEKDMKHAQEINKLQDKIIELQMTLENSTRINDEMLTRLKKYKLSYLNLRKSHEKLSNSLNERSLQNINDDINDGIKRGNILLNLKACNDAFLSKNRSTNGSGIGGSGDYLKE